MILRFFCYILPLLSMLCSVLHAADEKIEQEEKKKTITIGVVQSGYSRFFNRFFELVSEELKTLQGEFTDIEYKMDFNAGGYPDRIRSVMLQALEDPTVDIVFTLSLIETLELTSNVALNKPVVSAFIQKADFLGSLYAEDDKSTIPNLAFVVIPDGLKDDLIAFHELVPFKRLHMLLSSREMDLASLWTGSIENLGRSLGFKVIFVPVVNVEEALSHLDSSVEAVYLSPLSALPEKEYISLIDGINRKKIPSFSMIGYEDVAKGVLAGNTPQTIQRIARRAALNLQQIILGESPNSLNVFLPITGHLQVNLLTAEKIHFEPSLHTLIYAEAINQEKVSKGKHLTLESAMKIAMSQNLDVAIQKAQVEIAREKQNRLLSAMGPQVYFGADYLQVDKDLAIQTLALIPEKEGTIGLFLQQMLFDDDIITRYRIAGRQKDKEIWDEEQIRLDVAEKAGFRFLDYLLAVSLLRLERQYLQLVNKNLELSRIRYKVGAAGVEEVYRWESAQAQRRSNVVLQETRMHQALVALNQVMGIDEETIWIPQDIKINTECHNFFRDFVLNPLKTNSQFDRFRIYSVFFAIQSEPALHAYDSLIEGQRMDLEKERRSTITPTIYLSSLYDHTIYYKPGFPTAPPLNNLDIFGFRVSLDIPVFDSWGVTHRVGQACAELTKLIRKRNQAAQMIEQRVLNSIYGVEGSLPRIELTGISVDRANRNLLVIEEKYSNGESSLLDILDAQSQSIDQQRSAIQIQIQYVKDLISYQRSIGWFEFLQTPEEKRAWLECMQRFVFEG